MCIRDSGTMKIDDALPFDAILKLSKDDLAARILPYQKFLSSLPPAEQPR